MVQRLGKKALLIFAIFLNLPLSSRATVLRQDVISYSLDYYEVKRKETAERQTVQQQQEESLEAKKKEAIDRWKARKEKINNYLKDTIVTLEAKATYNDNLFLSDTNKQSDIVNILSIKADYIPKVDWERKRKTEFFFDFQGDGLSYSTGKSKENTRTGLRTGLNYRITDKYGALLDYQFVKSQATATGSTEGDNEFVQNLASTFGGKLSADWGRFPCSLRYTHETSNFADEDFETSNSIKDIMAVTGNVRISSKTQVFVGYDYGTVAFPKNKASDYLFTTYSTGIRGKLSSKITGIIRLGWGGYDYDAGGTRQTEELGGDINYKLSDRFLFSTGGNRSIEATTYSTNDASEQRNIHFQCKYFPPFNKKLALNGGMNFSNVKLVSSNREDDKTQMRLGAEYGLNRHTKLVLNYSSNTRESNEEGKDYKQNIISLRGTFDF